MLFFGTCLTFFKNRVVRSVKTGISHQARRTHPHMTPPTYTGSAKKFNIHVLLHHKNVRRRVKTIPHLSERKMNERVQ